MLEFWQKKKKTRHKIELFLLYEKTDMSPSKSRLTDEEFIAMTVSSDTLWLQETITNEGMIK